MYLASGTFDSVIKKPERHFRARLTCGDECIEDGFNSINIYGGSNNGDTITIGSTISQRIEVEMQETDVTLSGKEWLLEIGLLVNGIMPADDLYPSDDWYPGETPLSMKSSEVEFYEYIPMGYFTPEKPSTDNGRTSFKAYDRMIKLSGAYTCLLSRITTLTVLDDISQKTGVPISTTGLSEIFIDKPEGYTYRETVMYIAQLYGMFANVSREGVIEFHWWSEVDGYEITADNTNGFKHDETNFSLGYVYVAYTDEEGSAVALSVGEGKQGISIVNPFMTQEVLESAFSNMEGFSYTVSDVNCILGDVRFDPWDLVSVVDTKGNVYKVPLMTLEFRYDGGVSSRFSAVGHSETEEEIDYKGPMKLLQERLAAKVEDTANELKSEIKQTADKISSKVSKGSVSSEISQEADLISIKGNRIAIKSDYFTLSEEGEIAAKSGSFSLWNLADFGFYNDAVQMGMINYDSRFGMIYGGCSYDDAMSDPLGCAELLIFHNGHIEIQSGEVSGSFIVSGAKSRLAKTKSYNDRLLYCYEMPSPIFGDVGHGVIGEDGLCYVDIDQIFFETIDTAQNYYVFLQSYSETQVYVLEKQKEYFIVKGTPNAEFDWEIKAKQLDFPLERLEEQAAEDNYKETDYVASANEYLNEYEQEVLNYE